MSVMPLLKFASRAKMLFVVASTVTVRPALSVKRKLTGGLLHREAEISLGLFR